MIPLGFFCTTSSRFYFMASANSLSARTAQPRRRIFWLLFIFSAYSTLINFSSSLSLSGEPARYSRVWSGRYAPLSNALLAQPNSALVRFTSLYSLTNNLDTFSANWVYFSSDSARRRLVTSSVMIASFFSSSLRRGMLVA
jgi:hypothetical protein